jgi:hypothetical protein|tara:strand:- start:397 stop:969 length:573 start_codon:yes stop_codon:yes gene_type:complete
MAFATIDVTKGITGTLAVANGGTGLASGTTGQLLKFTGSTTLASSAISTGKIGQVVDTRVGDAPSHIVTTSTSLVDSGIARTITPSASSSKIIVRFFTGMAASGTDNDIRFALYRDSTNLTPSAYNWTQFRVEGGSSGTNYNGCMAELIDSPSSSSEINYKIYYKSANGGQVYACQDGGGYTLTCMEVLA